MVKLSILFSFVTTASMLIRNPGVGGIKVERLDQMSVELLILELFREYLSTQQH